MKCTSISSVLVSVFVLVVFASCGRREDADVRKSGAEQPADGTVVLAEVGGRRITLAEFEAERERRGQEFYTTEEQRRKLLDEMVAFEFVLAKAKAAGYDRTHGMQTQIDRLIVARFQEEQFAALAPPTAPDETQLRMYYQGHQEQFTTPARVRAGLIHFHSSSKATADKRAELRQRAEAVLEEARKADSAAFTLLAQKHSEDQATRYHGGDAGWINVGDASLPWAASVTEAAFGLTRPGDCASLVETPSGFYIVRLLDKQAGRVRAFDDVKEAIAYQVSQQQREQRQQAFLEEMQRGIRVEKHPDFLKHINTTEQAFEAAPPPIPGS